LSSVKKEVQLGPNISIISDRALPFLAKTAKSIENTTRSGVLLTNFEVFGNAVKYGLEFRYIFSTGHENYGENE